MGDAIVVVTVAAVGACGVAVVVLDVVVTVSMFLVKLLMVAS